MDHTSSGFRFIGGVLCIGAAAAIPKHRSVSPCKYPQLSDVTPKMRSAIDDFFSQKYCMAVPSDWIVWRKAAEEYRTTMGVDNPDLTTWIGLADYLNIREKINLSDRGFQYTPSYLVLQYIIGEWLPAYGFRPAETFQKYADGIAQYLDYTCHPKIGYPIRNRHGQIIQNFLFDAPSIQSITAPSPSEFLISKIAEQAVNGDQYPQNEDYADYVVNAYVELQEKKLKRELRMYTIRNLAPYIIICIVLPILQHLICD